MGFSPRLDALAVCRPAEVILILRFLQPAALRFGFTLSATGGLRAVALVVTIAGIGSKELLAMAALAFDGAFHRPTQSGGRRDGKPVHGWREKSARWRGE